MFHSNRKAGELRRVVTGFDSSGKSIVQSDSVIQPQQSSPDGKFASTAIWSTNTFPANVLDPTDGAQRKIEGMGIRSPNGANPSEFN
jgi:hypothetical protein